MHASSPPPSPPSVDMHEVSTLPAPPPEMAAAPVRITPLRPVSLIPEHTAYDFSGFAGPELDDKD